MESLQHIAAMGPSSQDSVMMLGAFFFGAMGWASTRRFLQVPRSKKVLDEDEELEQVCTSTGNAVDEPAGKETGTAEVGEQSARTGVTASKKSAFQKKQTRKARRSAEKKVAVAAEDEAAVEPAPECEGSSETAGEHGGDDDTKAQEVASTCQADIASGPASTKESVPAASPLVVAPDEAESAATGVEEKASAPALATEPLVEALPSAAEADKCHTGEAIPEPEKKPVGKAKRCENVMREVAAPLPDTSPSSKSPADRERLKLEKKLREVAKLEERAAAGEALESLQLEKMAKADQLRSELAQLNAQDCQLTEEQQCVEDVAAVHLKEVQAWSEVPPVQAWQEVKELGAWADVECTDNDRSIVNDKSALHWGMRGAGMAVPEREFKENTWQGSRAQARTDGSAWSSSRDWEKKNGKDGNWSWKESWSQRRAAQAQRRGEDAWMEPLDPFAEVQTNCLPCGVLNDTAVSDDICWNWQKWGCCEKFARGKCGWEHPVLEERPAACPIEDASQVQYCYQLVEVDAATLGMMGGAEVPMLMQGGTEMLAQDGPEVYDQVFMPSCPDVPMHFEAQVYEPPSCQREGAYWEDWEEEQVNESNYPLQPQLPVFDGWVGPVVP